MHAPTCLPSGKSLEKFERVVKDTKTKRGKFVSLLKAQELAGIFYFISKFVPHGRSRCNAIFGLLSPTMIPRQLCRITTKVIDDAEKLLHDIKYEEKWCSLTNSPFFYTQGLRSFTADAAGISENQISGWGVNARHKMSWKAWGVNMRKAWELKKISISPLELFAIAALVKMFVGKDQTIPERKLIIYTDSASSVPVINSGRTKSATMAKALELLMRECSIAKCEILAVHIPGTQNVTTDALSRGNIELAKQEAKKLFGSAELIEPHHEIVEMEEELAELALKSRSAISRSFRHH